METLERRLGKGPDQISAIMSQASDLPKDFLKLVKEIFTTNFEEGLTALAKIHPGPRFEPRGAVFADEVVLSMSLILEAQLAATTGYASCDFDPKASSPTAQEVLAACLDALGSLFDGILDAKNPERLKQLVGESLSAIDDAPYDWSPVEVDRFKIYLKIDKTNPALDEMADEWLKKHDPDRKARKKREHEETEKLFVSGPRKPGSSEDDDDPESIH